MNELLKKLHKEFSQDLVKDIEKSISILTDEQLKELKKVIKQEALKRKSK